MLCVLEIRDLLFTNRERLGTLDANATKLLVTLKLFTKNAHKKHKNACCIPQTNNVAACWSHEHKNFIVY